jgi:lysophospholipase
LEIPILRHHSIAWDSNEDANPFSWNNGTNLYNTYFRANVSGIPFPIVPTPAAFINKNFTTHPVFFGCNTELTTTKPPASLIIAYFANAPSSAYTNYSAFQSATSLEQMQEILVNSFKIVTQGNGTLGDPKWSTCLGCAAIDRSLIKIGMHRTMQCEECFSRYCWDGTMDNREAGVVDLALVLDPSLGFIEWNKTHRF